MVVVDETSALLQGWEWVASVRTMLCFQTIVLLKSIVERTDRFAGYSTREQLPIPDKPPYTAHLANLSFDVTQDDIRDFFRDCEVTNIRIVEDKMDRKPKGFGYVEFGSVDGLKKALDLSSSNLAGRSVRISVADPPKGGQESNRDFSDWSRKGPLPDLPGQSQRRTSERGFNRNFDERSDAGSDRGSSRRGFGGDSDGKVRDFSNWERKGPLSPAALPDRTLGGAGRQMSKDGDFRRNSPSWGEGRSQEGSRPPRREFTERPPIPAREPTAAEMDNQWRAKMRPDAPAKSPEPETSTPSSPAPPAAPAGRPKLNLQKRTVSEAQPEGQAAATQSSIFGSAKPVDTAAKEREVEEKRQETIRARREADEKAKADKAEEKRLAREKALAERANKPNDSNDVDENEESNDQESKPQPKFELLRRQVSENNDMVADEDAEEDEAPAPERDTAVKPKEITRDPPTKANGAWRKKSEPAAEPAADTETAQMQEDGWSTVSKSKKQSNNRRNQQPRAIAS